MFYLAAAGAGLSAVSGLLQSKEQGKVAIAESKAAIQRLGALRDQLSLQSAQNARNTSAALFNVQVQGEQAESQIRLQSASTDTIGASVQDALSTVAVVTGRQEAAERYNYTAAEEELFRTLSSEARATGQEQRANLSAAINSQRSVALGIGLKAAATGLGSAGEDIGKNYANNRLGGQGFGTALSNAFSSYLK